MQLKLVGSGVSVQMQLVWLVVVSSLVDRGWGVSYWFVYVVCCADHFLFEIGSQFFDSSLLWSILVFFFLWWTGGREVVEVEGVLE